MQALLYLNFVMKINDFGLTTSIIADIEKKYLWIRADNLSIPAAVCVNFQIMPTIVSSDDRSILTVEIPRSLAFTNCELSIQLLNLLTGTRSEIIKIKNEALIKNSAMEQKSAKVLICCFPKSGSTLLLDLLTKATGYLSCPMVYEYGGNEQDLYLPSVIDAYCQQTVTQQHVRATKTNLRIIGDYGFKTVILTRNIFDTLVSLHDHLIRESYEIPLLYVDRDFELLSFEGRIDMLIDLALPWYIDFYVSWFKNFPDIFSDSLIWMRYEELIVDPKGSIDMITKKFGLPYIGQSNGISNLLANGGATRLNVGVTGRGIKRLSNSQKEKVIGMFKHHPNVNFSRIL
jgi:hypothetical protein